MGLGAGLVGLEFCRCIYQKVRDEKVGSISVTNNISSNIGRLENVSAFVEERHDVQYRTRIRLYCFIFCLHDVWCLFVRCDTSY